MESPRIFGKKYSYSSWTATALVNHVYVDLLLDKTMIRLACGEVLDVVSGEIDIDDILEFK